MLVLIERSVETPRPPSIATRSLAGPTSRRPCRHDDLKRPQVNFFQYPRISSRILKGVSYEEVFYNVIDEVVIFIAIDDEAAR
jgi:hypothetical protein